MVLLTFIRGVFKEALAKKILLTIIGFFSLIIILLVVGITNSYVEGMQAMLEAGGQNTLSQAVNSLLAAMTGAVPMFMLTTLMIILTSSFIPDMVKKGHIDLLLSKPISRTKIILGHFFAGIIIVLLSFILLLGIIWFIISIKTGYWNFEFLKVILIFTLIYAVLYSSVIFFALITRSTILTIIINLFMFFPLTFGLYYANQYFESTTGPSFFSPFWQAAIKFLYNILPKVWDMHDYCAKMITNEGTINYFPLTTSLLFMLILLSFSIWYFNKKDY
jgi:ABC-2 type transport system permease protein